jgi:flagellin
MTSILTNNSAMVALQTLRTINQNLASTQAEISSGKKVATAKDNASVFAISAVMQSDVSGFKAITESLSLGDASIGVARAGAETVTGLFNDLKGRIVASQESNVDRSKIQADVVELRNQVVATVDASQFNGLNLLKADPKDSTVSILGSLNRATSGVTTSSINVDRQSLEAANTTGTAATATGALPLAAQGILTLGAPSTFAVGDVVAIQITNDKGEGEIFQTKIQASDLSGTPTAASIATAVSGRLNTDVQASTTITQAGTFTIASDATGAITATTTGALTTDTKFSAVSGGGLAALSLVDVSTEGGAKAALSGIEGLIQSSVNAASTFGSAQKRIDNQSNFIAKLTDSLTSGIGALVDVDLEAASARLQALQVQQQLGTQALSIANQQASSVLALFR